MELFQHCNICFGYFEKAECKSLDTSCNLIDICYTYLHNGITSETLGDNKISDSKTLCEDCFNSALELKLLTDQLQNIDTNILDTLKKTIDIVLEFSLQILCGRTRASLKSECETDTVKSKNVIDIHVPKGFGLLLSSYVRKQSPDPELPMVKDETDIVYENYDYGTNFVKDDPFFDPLEESKTPIAELINKPPNLGTANKLAPLGRRSSQNLQVNLKRLLFNKDGEPIPQKERENISNGDWGETVAIKREIKLEDSKTTKYIPRKKYSSKDEVKKLLKAENVDKIRQRSSGFECRFCWIKHVKWQDHKNHLEEAHGRKRQFQCFACDKTFSQKHHMDTHVRIHTGEKPFKCSFCPKKFSDGTAHSRHTKIHTGEKKYRCTLCEYGTSDGGAFGRHKLIHSNDYQFKCKICKKGFKIKCTYKDHLKSHSSEKPYKCSICEKDLKSKQSLKMHKSSHSEETPFKCSVCQKGFKRKVYLVDHQRIHTGEKPFNCLECNQSFSQFSNFWFHQKRHEGKVFKCNLCRFVSTNEDSFKAHGNTHLLESNRNFPFKCRACGKYFKLKSRVVVHYRQFHPSIKFTDKCALKA